MAGTGKPSSDRSGRSANSNHSEEPAEDTPLLSREPDESGDDRAANGQATRSPAASLLLRSIQGNSSSKKSRLKRWPSILALVILCNVVIAILIFAFLAPQIMEEYAAQAIQFEPTSLSIDTFTASGVVAHVQGTFQMDGSQVKKKSVRDLGRFGTWVVKEVESKAMDVQVSFPEYGNPIVGTAQLPAIKVDVREGHITGVDFFTNLIPGSKEAVRRVADDWLKGSLGQLRIQAKADLKLKSGLFALPKQTLSRSIVFESNDIPAIPKYDIKKINVREEDLPNGKTGLAAEASIKVKNKYPIDLTVPPLGFAILLPNCGPSDPRIMLADGATGNLHVRPRQDITLNVTGYIRQLPDAALVSCPKSHKSPLDRFLGKYIHGNETTVFVRGSDSPSLDTPQWITDIISEITVPVPFPGRDVGGLIKKFSLDDVHFDLPDFFADPDSPASKPRISADILALIDLPDEINFPIKVHRVKADADLYYRNKTFGNLDLSEWREASSKVAEDSKHHHDLEIRSKVVQAPLTITDASLFSEILQEILTGRDGVNLTAKAVVDVEMGTALGKLVVKDIPAEGDVPVNPLGGGDISSFAPKVGNLQIVETSPDSVTLNAAVNFSNPTKYSANVPFIDLKILVNDTLVGHATARNVSVGSGDNNDISVSVLWEPKESAGKAVGREAISQYLSGYNVSLTFKPYEGSIPSQPALGKALSVLEVTIPIPRIRSPDDGDGDGDGDDDDDGDGRGLKFIRDTTMHLLTSTATFYLVSPLVRTKIYITHLNATALFHADPVGHILYDGSIEVPPGASKTPRLPVEWSLDSVGYEAIRKALGGTLKLDAVADVGVQIGRWSERIWYEGSGIGAKVRP